MYILTGIMRLVRIAAELNRLACRARRLVLLMAAYDPGIHLGSSLSVLEILTVLYGTGRVRFLDGSAAKNWLILSKGHAVHAIYALAAISGIISIDELRETGSLGSLLQNHPELGVNWIDVATSGSLGQGVSIGVGIALGLKRRGSSGRVYVVVGDGELDEGQTYEALATAAHYRLENFVPIIDFNRVQLDGPVDSVRSKGDLQRILSGMGYTVHVVDGHNVEQLAEVLDEVDSSGAPNAVVAYTKRGRGVPQIEDTPVQRIPRDLALQLVSQIRCNE